MASLYKRKKGGNGYVYYVTWYQHGKARMKSTGTADRTLAMEVLRKVETDNTRIAQGLKPEEKFVPLLLAEFTEIFLADRREKGFTQNTIEAYEYALKNLLRFTGDRLVSAIDEGLVRAFRKHLTLRLRPASVYSILKQCRAAFAWGVNGSSDRYLYASPFDQKDLFPNVGETLPRSLTPDEKSRFFAAIKGESWLNLFKFYSLTGCRRNEALNLEWGDINLGERRMAFRNTKNKKDRSLPIGIELMQVLLSLDRNEPRPFGNYRPRSVSMAFKRLARKAGLAEDLHLHCLRHSVATELILKGVPLKLVSKMLGHSSIAMTEKYTHVLPDDLRDAADLLTCIG